MFFSQTTYILMFFQLTGAVAFSWTGALILGGLYWKRGTAPAAMATIVVGATLAIAGFLAEQYWASGIYPWMCGHAPGLLATFTSGLEGLGELLPIAEWRVTPDRFPITGQEVGFLTAFVSIGVYVVVSLLTCREPFNMERLLHRGQYRVDAAPDQRPASSVPRWKRLFVGIDEVVWEPVA